MSTQITVIVCTFNRSSLLRTALESIAGLEMPDGVCWDVLVADNNSSDGTRGVVEDFMRRHPGRFRYIFEPQPGKSNALNSAIVAAQGDVLAFADDDITLDRFWLHNLTAPLLNEEWIGAGGRVVAQWDSAVPRWLELRSSIIAGPLVCFDRGTEPGPLREAPIGANMAFHRRAFEVYGRFRTDLGPRPGGEVRNEDSEFARRLLKANEPLCYVPSAIVYHPVPENRLRKDYFLKWWYDKGRTEIREKAITSKTGWKIDGVPLVMLRRLVRWTICWMIMPNSRKRFVYKVKLWNVAGAITEFLSDSAASSTKIDKPAAMASHEESLN